MLSKLSSVSSPRAGIGREMAAAGHISSRAWAAEQWAAWFGSRINCQQLVSRGGGVCVARSPRAPTSVMHSFCEASERSLFASTRKPWGFQFGFLALLAVELSVLVSPLARDCILVRFLRIFRPFQFLSLFRLTSAATHLQRVNLASAQTRESS